MTITAFALDAVSGAPAYTGQQWRAVLSALMGAAPSGRPLGAVSGVRLGTPSNTVTATSTTWTVKTHSGIIDAESAAAAGAYLYAVTANETGSMTAANGSNPRIDLISVQISDPSQGDGTSTPQAAVVYTTGTAAASPAVPATPARAYPLAQISVPTSGGGSPSVTWVATSWNDTGWVDLTSIVSGWAVPGGQVAQARRIGTIIYCRGFLQNSSFAGSGFTTVAQLPAAVGLPATSETFGVGGNTVAIRSWQLTSTGALQAVTSAATASFYGLASIRAFTD